MMFKTLLNAMHGKKEKPVDKNIRKIVRTEQAIVPTYTTDRGLAVTPARITTAHHALDAGDFTLAAELYDDMETRDLHLGAVMQSRVSATPFKKRVIMPGKKRGEKKPDKKAEEIADFVTDVFNDIGNLAKTLKGIQRVGLFRGAALTEIFWVVRNGRVVIDKLELKNNRYLVYTNQVNPEKLLNFPRWATFENPTGVELDRQRFVYYTPLATDDHAVRSGMNRGLIWYWLFTGFTIKDWMVFNETFGQPLRLGKYPANSSDKDIDILKTAMRDLGVSASGVIPTEMIVEIIEAKQSGKATYQPAAEYFNSEKSKKVLGQTLTTEQQGSSSSNAMAQVHERTLASIAEDDAELLEEAITQDIVVPLVDFNFGPQEVYPYFHFPTEEAPDIGTILDNAKKFKDLGYKINPEWLQEETGVPLKEVEVVEAKQSADKTNNQIMANEAVNVPRHFSISMSDKIYDDAENRIAAPAYDALIASIEPRFETENDIRPMTDDEIKLNRFYESTLAVMLSAAVTGQGSVMLETARMLPQANEGALYSNAVIDTIAGDYEPGRVLTAEEARKWWVNKLALPAKDYAMLLAREKQAAFAVAKNEDMAAIINLKDLFTEALTEAKTPLLTFRGWFKKAQKTGIKFISKDHAETVFRNNTQSAFGAQRYRAYNSSKFVEKLFPYYKIITVNDASRSEICDGLDGITLRRNDSFWKTHWNPFHHNCRSTVVGITKYEKVKVTKTKPDLSILPKDFGNPALARWAISDPGQNF